MRSLTHQSITWHDDPSPSQKELEVLQGKYGFHELDIEDCLSEQERPKIEEYDTYIFLVFHIPYLRGNTGRIHKEEVDIFLGADFIVTLHQGKLPVFDTLWREFQESQVQRQEYLRHGTGYFLYELMNRLFEGLFPLVDQITKQIRRMEDTLFDSNEEADILRDILTVKRNIISMRSILLPQRTLVAALEHKNRRFIPEELELYFDNISDAIERQWALLETAKEMIDALQDSHESWLSHKTNAIVRVLTAFSATMLPLTVVTGFYGMNVDLPFSAHPHAVTGIGILMALTFAVMLVVFLRKKWL